MNILFMALFGFIGGIAFAVTLNAPRKELFFVGICSLISAFVHVVLITLNVNEILATFCASIAISLSTRFLSFIRKCPSTVYLTVGILPLVPGSIMYSAIYGLLSGNLDYAAQRGILAFEIAGAIVIGIIFVFALPYSFFEVGKNSKEVKK